MSDVDQIVSLVRFSEPAGMPNGDDRGALLDLFPVAGALAPAREAGVCSVAAVFNPSVPNGIKAKDAVAGGTVLPRDMSVMAIMRWDISAQNSYGAAGSVVARGLGTGGVESMPFAIELHVIDAANRIGEVRFLWHTIAGVLKTESGGLFIVPAEYFMMTATRRWISPTEVVLRYYINSSLLTEVSTPDGDIAASVDGTTTIGTRYTGAAFGRFLAGAIDELAILNYEVCREEIEATWLRVSVYQPDGYRQLRDLMPPGIPISDDPASRVQSDLTSMGIALGFADGQIENVRQNLMPDRAYGEVLRRWERITEQPRKQGDSLDKRRGRVVGHLRSRAGVSVDGIDIALADVLDCAPGDLEVIAFDNTITDAFATLAEERWKITNGGVDVTGGKLRIQGANGTSYPWDGTSVRGGLFALLPAEAPRGFNSSAFMGGEIFGSLNPTTLPANSDAGFVLWSDTSKSMLFFGLRNVAGSYKVGYQRYSGGIATDGSWIVIATTSLAKHYLRIRSTSPQPVEGAGVQSFQLSYSTTDFAEASFATTTVAWLRSYQWAGFYHRSTAALGSASDVRLADFAFRNTQGTRPFYFYVYRDPALGGSPDIAGANRILERMRHGYTFGRVITSKSLLAGDPASVVDGGPMGAL